MTNEQKEKLTALAQEWKRVDGPSDFKRGMSVAADQLLKAIDKKDGKNKPTERISEPESFAARMFLETGLGF